MTIQIDPKNEAVEQVDVAGVDVTVAAEPNEIEILKKELEAAKIRADQAEIRARTASTERDTQRVQLSQEVSARFSAQEQATEAKIASAASDLKSAKSAMVEAQKEGKFEEAAELAEQISQARYALNVAGYEKDQLAQYKARAEAQPAPSQDPVEALISSVGDQNSQRWLRNHPDIAQKMATDNRFMAKMASIDNAAYADGLERSTPEYFAYVEQELGLNAEPVPAESSNVMTQTPPTKAKPMATAAAAPARRAAAGATQAGRTTTIDQIVRRLTPTMREAARVSAPDLSEEKQLERYAYGIVKEKQRDPSFLPDFQL